MVDFPAGDPDIPTAALTGESLGTMHGGAGHPAATNRLLTNLKAIGAKLGYGTSLPGAVAGVLRRTASGQSAWGPLVNADVDAAAAIAYGKLALVGQILNADIAPTAGIAKVKLAALNIADADVVSGAAIHPSKLGGGGTGNRVVKTVDGTAMVMGQISDAEVASGAAISKSKLAALGIVDADVASGAAIGLAKLLHVGAGNVLKSNGSQNVPGQIANADVASGALIDLSKLAPGASGVLKSNGAAISAGNLIADADFAANTIHANKLQNNTIGDAQVGVNAVSGNKITDNTIANSKIVEASLTGAKIATSGVATINIAPGAVTARQWSAQFGASIAAGPWQFTGGYVTVSCSVTADIMVWFVGTAANTIADYAKYLGISQLGTLAVYTSGSYSSVVNHGQAFSILALFPNVAPGSYNVHGLYGSQNGTITIQECRMMWLALQR